MINSNDSPEKSRTVFYDAWRKFKSKESLSTLEQQIVDTIIAHPEYEDIFNNPEEHLYKEYSVADGENNPFLHLSLHLSIIEQVKADNPAGFRDVYQQLVAHFGSPHQAEHEMLTIITENIWKAMKHNNQTTDEEYLAQLRNLMML